MRILPAVLLLACATGAGAQARLPTDTGRDRDAEWSSRVPKGGVAPILDMRIQDAGITLPPESKPEEPKAETKPAAASDARPSAPPAPPAPPK